MPIKIFREAEEILTLAGAAAKGGRRVSEADLSIIPRASMVVRDGRIEWIGPHRQLPREYARTTAKEVSLKGLGVMPALVECHTHSVFAGNRAEEFEWRNQGTSYQEIAARGGGILSTMKATRKASAAELVKLTQARMNAFVRQGVTTVESKSGYALDAVGEIKMLQTLKKIQGPRTVGTFLGAHALPPEFKDHESYLNFLVRDVLPKVKKAKLASRVDIFVEKGFFEAGAAEKYLRACAELGFAVTVHADQLSLSGGAALAVNLHAHSADHVIRIGAEEVARLAASETTAVLLPMADLYMKCPYPPARALLEAGARVALASDFNPGTSPSQDVSLVGLLARLEMKMSLPEVIAGYTLNAAHALALGATLGSLEANKFADFLCIKKSWRELFYSPGSSDVFATYKEGSQLRA